MKTLIVIIGDHFVGGTVYYKALLSTLHTRKINAIPVPIVSSKKVLGFGEELIISSYLSELVKEEPWAYRVPGQPGYYLIKNNGEPDNDIGVMSIPARGKATVDFIKSISPDVNVITVMLNPESLDGAITNLITVFGLNDSVAVSIYNSYISHNEWRVDIGEVDIKVNYKNINSLGKITPQSISDVIKKLEEDENKIESSDDCVDQI